MSNTRFIGKVYHRFEELPSTNDWALELCSKTRPMEGMVVRADNQTAGRGQFGSSWQSERGKNLLLSVVFQPGWLAASEQFFLSMAVALALREAVAETVPALAERLAIKWPNDVYADSRKLAGILIHFTFSGQQLQYAVVGIGLNVNQMDFPADLPNPSSLALETGQSFDLDILAETLFERLEGYYLQLKAGEKQAIKSAYERHLWQIDQEQTCFTRLSDGNRFLGKILGVTDQGLLRIQSPEGERHFDLKTVKIEINVER